MISFILKKQLFMRDFVITAIEADEQVYHKLTEQLRSAENAKSQLEAEFREERRTLRAEIDKLKLSLRDVEASSSAEQGRTSQLEQELHQTRAQVEGEQTTCRILEGR